MRAIVTGKDTSGSTVLFGDRSTHAFIALAVQEGLLEQGPGDNDFIVDSLRSVEVPDWLRKQISQQILLYPHVLSTRKDDRHIFAGELLEVGILRFSPARTTDDAEAAVALDNNDALAMIAAEAMLGLLAAAGVNMSLDELIEAFTYIQKEDVELAHDLRSVGIDVESVVENKLSVVFGLALRRNRTSEAEQLMKRTEKLDRVTSPILRAFTDLEQTISRAQTEGIGSVFLPLGSTGRTEFQSLSAVPQSRIPLEPSEAVLMRVVTERLGRLPYRMTLRDSIAVARSSATADLRELLHQWAAELPNGVTDQLTAIERETKKAMLALAAAQEAAFGSQLITYIGGAATVLSAATQIPPEYGIATVIVGLGCQVIADRIRKTYNWAAFGNN